ncbi:hypothetical protein [Sporisorium scitamineum]|nr:hypothetical protein [Sporisorium scitamineum]
MLPQEAEASLDTNLSSILSRLVTLSQLLAIPTQFASGDGQAWTHSEQHYPVLLQWKEQQVPALLAQVEQLLGELAGSNVSNLPQTSSKSVELVLGHVVCAVSRYLPAYSVAFNSEPSPSHRVSLQDGWTSNLSETKARSVLATLRKASPSDSLPASSTIAKALLTDYIKPIFRETASSSSASTSSVNSETGRRNPPAAGSLFISYLDANLGQHRFSSADQDSDAANLAPQRFSLHLSHKTLRTNASQDSGGDVQSLVERNEALGCVNVLSWCLDALRLESESDWSEVWPLVVPPLLTLLEHPQPRFRLRGSVVVHQLLLKPSQSFEAGDAEQIAPGRRQKVLGNMLVRTGIGSLLERTLHVNLTYIHDQHAPALLEHSISALRQLILLTTHPIAYRETQAPLDMSSTGLDAEYDCGKHRMEALFRLLSEGVLSTWSYLPLPPSGTRLGREVVNVTCSAYMILVNDLAPPLSPHRTTLGGAARFLNVTLDWIFRSWLSNVAFDHTDQVDSTINVLTLADRLLFPSEPSQVRDSGAPWASRRSIGLMLSSVAKCWIQAVESHLRSSRQVGLRWDELERWLSRLLVKVSQADHSVEARWSELVKLDQRLEVLLPSH